MIEKGMSYAETVPELEIAAARLTAALDANIAVKGDPDALRELVTVYAELTNVLIRQIHILMPTNQVRADLDLIGEMAAELGAEYHSAWQRVSAWLATSKETN